MIHDIKIGRKNFNIDNHLNVYCGRGSPFGNPYHMSCESERDEVCRLFQEYFDKEIKSKESPLYREMKKLFFQRL